MKIKLTLGFLASFFVVACASNTPDPELEKAKFLKPEGDAVAVEFTDRKLANSVVGLRATSITALRGGSLAEIGGSGSSQSDAGTSVEAPCTLDGNGYHAEFTAPAVVNMPSFGSSTQSVKVSCEYNGETITRKFKPINLSSSSRTGAAVAVGVLLCPICGAAVAVNNGGAKQGDAYGFENIVVKMN